MSLKKEGRIYFPEKIGLKVLLCDLLRVPWFSIGRLQLFSSKAVSGDKVGIKIQNIILRKGLLYKVQDDVGLIQKKGLIQMMELFIKARKTWQFPDKEKIAELLNTSLRGVE